MDYLNRENFETPKIGNAKKLQVETKGYVAE